MSSVSINTSYVQEAKVLLSKDKQYMIHKVYVKKKMICMYESTFIVPLPQTPHVPDHAP